MTGPTVRRCAMYGCTTLTASDRCQRHTATPGAALTRRLSFGGTEGADLHVVTLALPKFESGDTVQACVTWQGPAPEPDDTEAHKALARLLRTLGAELGVRIEVAADE